MTIRLAAIGLGTLGEHELETYEEIPDVDITAGADIEKGKRERFESRFDAPAYETHEQLLEAHGDELDAASIVTPHTLHYEQAMACLERELHLFIEKPLVTDVTHAQTLVKTADRQGCVLVVGYQRHYHPVYKEIKRRIESGQIGRVHSLNCYMGQHWIRKFENAWRTNPSLSGGGQLYDSGSHLLDTLLWTTGTTPVAVGAMMDTREHDVDVTSALTLSLERNGNPVTGSVLVTADGTEDPSTYEGLVIWGTDGRLTYTRDTLTITRRDTAPEEITVDGATDFKTLLRYKLTDFIEAVRGEHEPTVPGSYGQIVVALTEAAYDAYQTGTTVGVAQYLETATPATD